VVFNQIINQAFPKAWFILFVHGYGRHPAQILRFVYDENQKRTNDYPTIRLKSGIDPLFNLILPQKAAFLRVCFEPEWSCWASS
jgi:hypothetical protein